MRPSTGERLLCVLIERVANQFDTESKGHRFYAKEVTSTSLGTGAVESTVRSISTGLTLYATNCCYLVKPGDHIEVNGNTYTVDRVELHKGKLGIVNSSEFDINYIERECPKTIYLI